MFLTDSHCHLDHLNYRTLHQDIKDVIKKAYVNNVKLMLTVSTSLSGFSAMIKNIGLRNDVLFSCGVHPINIDEDCDLNKLLHLATTDNVVAIGETGLDYYYQYNNKKKQKLIFRKHIHVAKNLNKPIIIHTRNAINDTLTILREENADKCSGIVHCFTENCTSAKILLDMGFYISFSGIITFRNTTEYHKILNYIPIDRILIETDSPYLSPVPHRGKENQPAYLLDIAKFIANIKKIHLKDFAINTTNNFKRLFKIIT